MSIFLYVKTHRITGLKYFGKTTNDDPYSYKGSGKHWRRHIAKHGYDVDTEIVGAFDNIDEASVFALNFSKVNDIVNSQMWANLIEENGIDGAPKGIVHDAKWREKQSKLRKGKPQPNISKAMKGKKQPNIAKGKSSKWLITYPDGIEETIFNLREFCRRTGLDQGAMICVSKGIYQQHHGYECEKLDDRNSVLGKA